MRHTQIHTYTYTRTCTFNLCWIEKRMKRKGKRGGTDYKKCENFEGGKLGNSDL